MATIIVSNTKNVNELLELYGIMCFSNIVYGRLYNSVGLLKTRYNVTFGSLYPFGATNRLMETTSLYDVLAKTQRRGTYRTT